MSSNTSGSGGPNRTDENTTGQSDAGRKKKDLRRRNTTTPTEISVSGPACQETL